MTTSFLAKKLRPAVIAPPAAVAVAISPDISPVRLLVEFRALLLDNSQDLLQ